MTKSDLVDIIAEDLGISESHAKIVVDVILENISKALKEGGRFSLYGLGTLKVSTRASRTGRNPQTGKSIIIPAKKIVTFKAIDSFLQTKEGTGDGGPRRK